MREYEDSETNRSADGSVKTALVTGAGSCIGVPGQAESELHLAGRWGHPEEVAALVRYLCSPEADFMHGSVLTIDGGWTAA